MEQISSKIRGEIFSYLSLQEMDTCRRVSRLFQSTIDYTPLLFDKENINFFKSIVYISNNNLIKTGLTLFNICKNYRNGCLPRYIQKIIDSPFRFTLYQATVLWEYTYLRDAYTLLGVSPFQAIARPLYALTTPEETREQISAIDWEEYPIAIDTEKEPNLPNNQLVSLYSGILLWKKMKQLNLSNNYLLQIPNISSMHSLRKIDLSNNRLTHFPLAITKAPSLRSINISNNKIEKLPDNIFNIINLRELDISNNQLILLPIKICKLWNLKFLNMCNNKIIKLPEKFLKLVNIKQLYIKNNELTEISTSIFHLKKLIELDVSHNKIEVIPSTICSLPRLSKFDFSNNPLTEVPPSILVPILSYFLFMTIHNKSML